MPDNICEICANSQDKNGCPDLIAYDGDLCHLSCALNDQDSIGMDAEFGDQ